jgi:hypothetical protein
MCFQTQIYLVWKHDSSMGNFFDTEHLPRNYTLGFDAYCAHARDFIVRFSHYFGSYNKRQDQGPEFQIFKKLNGKFSYLIGFLLIPLCRQQCTVLLRVFGKNT